MTGARAAAGVPDAVPEPVPAPAAPVPAPESAPRAASARDEGIDCLRGAAIVLVVAGHALLRAGLEHSWAFAAIVAVNMPLFAFVGGLVLRLPRGGLPAYLGRRGRSLLVPYLAWLPVYYALSTRRAETAPGEWFAAALVFPHAEGRLWFLYTLFLALAVVAALVSVRLRPAAVLAAAVGIAAVMVALLSDSPDYLGHTYLAFLLPFTAFGYFVGARGRRMPRSVVALGVVTAAFVALVALSGDPAGQAPWTAALSAGPGFLVRAASRTTRYAAGVGGILAFLAAERWLAAGVRRAGAAVGRRSLGIYATHTLFLSVVTPTGYGGAVLCAALAVLGGLALTLGLERVPGISELLLGAPARRLPASR